MKELREFLEECKHNQKVNFEKGLENRVALDYVIERLEDIKKYWICYTIYTIEWVEDYIERTLKDNFTTQEDKIFLESLNKEDIQNIADKVMFDEELQEELENSIRHYVWHYKKEQ